ncbi:putative hybrid PKS-NRPS enzyme [Cadophora sp. DSE1049]|nr:putative hybrid PKS-NRPS enzyme [Cadophora sp. DSE1049]
MPTPNEPIAIIGTGCRFPGNTNTPSELWDLLHHPRDVLSDVPEDRFNAEAFYHPNPDHHGTTNVKKSYFLSQDPRRFDAHFFGMQPKECDAIDPQQRMLLETIYESISAAGLTLEGLRGSSTAIYVGLMCDDWSGILSRDWDAFPTYSATGMARSIISNRISYFFDWHGPSMTIDTACSSSLIAVHQAIQTLRSGESRVAVAAGMYIAESKLHMLSPSGRCRMWDNTADGYARGEGIAAVVLKTLSDAIADGDHIECIIRETGTNQDGRTTGITMPNNVAQTALIRDVYARAGLDLDNVNHHPQYFHAHGTGTPAGDPQEAEAIQNAFFRDRQIHGRDSKLYVGSIKTIIGHTEGTAGLASLIGASLAVQHGFVPANMHFENLSEKVAPFYDHLEVPTASKPWPALPEGTPRRVSVNSFGFGGSNAHAIVESWDDSRAINTDVQKSTSGPLFTPFTFSAATSTALHESLKSFQTFLKESEDLNLHDLAWTLQLRRSALAFKATISGSTKTAILASIDDKLEVARSAGDLTSLGIRSPFSETPRILWVFTGQGAQWPTMGRELVVSSLHVQSIIAKLDHSLANLPEDDRPLWSIKDLLLGNARDVDFGNASISQPLCTAVQIVLVELLCSAGIHCDAVVGHSSGEIGAAFAAGLISASAAIRVAYYRGLYATLAKSTNGQKGAMMAVGTSLEDATAFCEMDEFQGRLVVAACNSSSSVTLSGDEDAIDIALQTFKDEQKFARKLNVDTAYHSPHMQPCSKPYLESIQKCAFELQETSKGSWYSSVYPGERMTRDNLTQQYWVDNMVNPVLFSDAVASAVSKEGNFNLVLEIGPHPALKSPCLANLEEITGSPGTPYSGVLSRGQNDVDAFSAALGFIWARFGSTAVDFHSYERLMSGLKEPMKLVVDLPTYPWDHQRSFWTESRISGAYRIRDRAPHPILGAQCNESSTATEIHWRNLLRVSEVPWLNGHKLQGQTVFPASGYVAMAVEAIRAYAGARPVKLFEIRDLSINRAITFDGDSSGVETLFSLQIVSEEDTQLREVTALFKCSSTSQQEKAMSMNATGSITISIGDSLEMSLPAHHSDKINLVNVEVDRFYNSLAKIGYNYSEPFRALSSIQRKVNSASGSLTISPKSGLEDDLLVHPGMLDTALQTIFAAFCSPGDNRLWSLHVPTNIDHITINPYFCDDPVQVVLPFQSAVTSTPTEDLKADVEIFSTNGQSMFIEIEGVRLVPFSRATPQNDSTLFSNFLWSVADVDGPLAARNEVPSQEELAMAYDLERVSFFYLKFLVDNITPMERDGTLQHYRRVLDWASHVVDLVTRGQNIAIPAAYLSDTHDEIVEIIEKYPDRADVQLIQVVGENLPDCIRTGNNILEFMTKDGLLTNFYEAGLGLDAANRWIGRMAKQISHRYPASHILEIGAGTGGATSSILHELGSAFSSYTYTDISSAFFENAETRFSEFADRMVFKTFDMEVDILSQGYQEGFYDVIVASNVLHATAAVEQALENTRRLLKPGGFLLFLEVINNDSLRSGLPMAGLPGWWVGADSGRPWGPTFTLAQWDDHLRKTGFSGVDTATPPGDALHALTCFASQAVDSRIRLLRQPLSDLPAIEALDLGNLVIIGGEQPEISRLVMQITNILATRYGSITNIRFVKDVSACKIPTGSTILCLSELDTPVFKSFSNLNLEYIKTLFNQAKEMLWITRGCRSNEPCSNMIVGVGRGLRFEYPNVRLQMLDIENIEDDTHSLVASYLLRLAAIHTWKRTRPLDLLWSMEPEIAIQGGKPILPRLVSNQAQNDRYNSSRRPITREVSVSEAKIQIQAINSSYELKDISQAQFFQEQPSATTKITLRVTHSLLRSIKVGSAGYLFLHIGNHIASGQCLLALSDKMESLIQVPEHCTVKCPTAFSPSQIILSVAGSLLSQGLMRKAEPGNIVVIHEPFDFITPSAIQLGFDRDIQVQFTATEVKPASTLWKYINVHLPDRKLKASLPSQVSLFVDLAVSSTSQHVGERIAKCYTNSGMPSKRPKLLSESSSLQPHSKSEQIGELLTAAWNLSSKLAFNIGAAVMPEPLGLSDVLLQDSSHNLGSIVDWTSQMSVPVKVEPVDSGVIFRPDRSYLLFGLSGEIGQSICQWMVERGARYVVLTSRSPKVGERWIASMRTLGADVTALSCDVTNRDSLHSLYKQVCQTLPPVAGIANGAMVLKDMLFQNMNYEDMASVLNPKVEGSKYLDELFPQNTLDFFILFSSITAVVGNTGQSNYIAANMFLSSLALQRKMRGLAGSVIDISSVIGIGYVERSDNFDAEYFASVGYTNISEQDLHQMFAEAILVGRPDSLESCEIVTGFAPAYADAEIKAPYREDLKFCHFIRERPREQSGNTLEATLPVRLQLATAKTRDEAYTMLEDSFTVRLKRILQIHSDGGVSNTMTLVEQGVDSLVAVEVRSWFLKEIDTDMPVLKVLGGASITDLIEDAIERLPEYLTTTFISAKTTSEEIRNESATLGGARLPEEPASTSVPSSEFTITSSSGSQIGSMAEQEETRPSSVTMSMSESMLIGKPSVSSTTSEQTERMSFGQSRFWFLNQFLQDPTTFNMAFSVRLVGKLSTHKLEKAIDLVANKHEALRTRFFSSGRYMEEPMQGILDHHLLRLKKVTISDEQEAQLELDKMRAHVWDLQHWETMKITLLQLSDTVNYLVIGCHHIAMDGLSFQIFFADLQKAYLGHLLEPCARDSQYRAFSVLQRQEYENGKMEVDFKYYRRIIPTDPKPLSLLPFAIHRSRVNLEKYSSHRADFRLDPSLTAHIKACSRKHKSTTFHFYLAALQALIFRFQEDTDDFFIGVADSNRNDSKFMGTLGFFLNLLPLRMHRDASKSFGDTIQDCRDKTYAALLHSKLPFDVLLDRLNIPRSASHTPLFQVFVDYRQGVQERTTFADCAAQGESWHIAKTGYDISLDIIENAAGDSLLTMRLQDTFYSEESTKMLLQSYVNLLESFARIPEMTIDKPSLWKAPDVQEGLQLGLGQGLKLEWPATLSHRVNEMVEKHGSALAIRDESGAVLTYLQMKKRVNAMSKALIDGGVVDGARIGVFQEPSADFVCSMLAIFQVGATYVPLDPRTALSRLATISEICGIDIIMVDNHTSRHSSSLTSKNTKVIDVSKLPRQLLDTIGTRAKSSSPAAILFTSGSTGIPKGIVIHHSSLRNQMESYSRAWGIADAVGIVLQQSAFSFDFSLDQIFSALANGGGLYIVPASKRGDPMEIAMIMASQGITYTSATPSEYLMWTRYGSSYLSLCSQWRMAFAGGEPLTEVLVQDIKHLQLPGLRFFNNYGPAEITIASTKIEVPYNTREPGDPLPAGFMLPNYSVYILDQDQKPVPLGFPGEIVIGGCGIAAGYLDGEDLTKEKFILDTFAILNSSFVSNGWTRMYRTGDRGRLLSNGALTCEGRIDGDTQIKLRGFRIEVEEIESTMLRVADGILTSAAVTLRGEDEGRFLVAHVEFSPSYTRTAREAFLHRIPSLLPLPDYMIPTLIIPIDHLPLSNHFKVDRAALRKLPLPAATKAIETANLTEFESRLLSLWQEVIPRVPSEAVTSDVDFFHVGGNSMLLVKLQVLIRERLNVAVRLVDLMNAGTLKDMASIIQNSTSSNIDWDEETALPDTLLSISNSKVPREVFSTKNLVVLLTGSTGYLGRHILDYLVTDPRIARIICVAVRDQKNDLDMRMAQFSDRITFKRGDLGYARMGLTDEDFYLLSNEVDVIIHSGANRSFWDSFSTLRSSNVSPIKELIRMSLPRQIPLHFISSGGVRDYNLSHPPLDGSDGYIASKWASEKILSNAAQQLGSTVYIHRPISYSGNSSQYTSVDGVLNELSQLAMTMKFRPSFTGLDGHIDMLPVAKLVSDLFSAIFDNKAEQSPSIIDHQSTIRVGVKEFIENIEGDEEIQALETMPGLEWIGEAKKNGLSYFIASQDIVMSTDTEGVVQALSSKR